MKETKIDGLRGRRKKINVTKENREFQREGSQQCKFLYSNEIR